MRGQSLVLLPLLMAGACCAREETGNANGASRRRVGLGAPPADAAAGHEFVSATPLTREVPEPEYVDRKLLLAEGGDWVGDEEDTALDIMVPEGAEFDYETIEVLDADEDLGPVAVYYEEDTRDEDYQGEWGGEERFVDMDIKLDLGDDDDGEVSDLTYNSENDADFYTQDVMEGEGFEEVGTPKESSYEPIARRLRRVTPERKVSGGETESESHKYLARKMSTRDDTDPTSDHDLAPYAGSGHLEESAAEGEEEPYDDRGRDLQCSNVKIIFKVDKYGRETTVSLYGNGRTQLQSKNEVGPYQSKTMQACVSSGTYTLKLVDFDGICCKNGNGYYKMWVNGQLVVSGAYFIGSKTHTVKVGYNWQNGMSTRDKQWLSGHNSRRRQYNGGQGYVPQRWSEELASQAKSYATVVGNSGCNNLPHMPANDYGENLASNQGSGTWGSLYSVEKIMGRWVEKEVNLSYPHNAHYTQVIWRASQYVGCGESAISKSGGQTCRVQVCRYARAGNCNVINGNWRSEAFKDDTGCGPPCAPEGCYV